jgi:hypothetical protein
MKVSMPPGMRRGDTQLSEDRALRRVADIVEDGLGWIFRGAGLPDYGVDAQIEVVAPDALVSGRLIGLQIKGGSSYFGKPSGDEGWTFRDSNHHLAYWLGHSLPVIVVLVSPNGGAFWQVISTRTVSEHEQGFSVVIPRSQPLDGSAKEALLSLAGRREGLLELLPGYCDSLPASAVSPIQRAEAADRLGASRRAAVRRPGPSGDDGCFSSRRQAILARPERRCPGPLGSCRRICGSARLPDRGGQRLRAGSAS